MSKKLRADVVLLMITIVWGASFPLMKIMLEYVPAFAYLSMRFLIAAIVLSGIFYKNFRKMNSRTLLYGCIIGLFMLGGMGFQVVGLYTTSASNSGFITGLNVVMVPFFAAVMLKKRPDRSSFIGVSIAFVGLFFLSGGLNFNFNFGDFLTFLCAICWAFQIIAIDKFTQTEDAPLLAIIQLFFIGIASTVFWLTADAGKPLEINSTVVIILLITGVLGSALAFGGQTIAQKDTTPTHTALILTAEPVFAAIFAIIIPNAEGVTEMPTLTKAIGCLLILAGMLVSELKPGRKKSGQRQKIKEQAG
jgi:drug/metabolite transporter (DMT)-like permease